MTLPKLFLENMQYLLDREFPAFLNSYAQPAQVGLRVNTLKITIDDLVNRTQFDLEPVPWCPTGFLLKESRHARGGFSPGKHPYHAAGLYYLQEPSAMAVGEIMDPQPGEKVLDLCAAPGGKTTHLASLMQGQGVLVANEMNSRRAWELAENLERWGVRRAIILNESPPRLAERFPEYFDRVLVDAPCSGEGMFRKNENSRKEWSPTLVQSCALRQAAILEDAVQMVRLGGWLVYSTCTFNTVENERVISELLDRHPEFNLSEIMSRPGFANAQPNWINLPSDSALRKAIRLWPHHTHGEGHFIALLQRVGYSWDRPHRASLNRIASRRVTVRQSEIATAPVQQAWSRFCQDHLNSDPLAELGKGELKRVGNYLFWMDDQFPNLDGLKVIRAGWWIGEIHQGQNRLRFEPAHALAMGLRPQVVPRSLDIPLEAPELLHYLFGDTLESPGEAGWVLITVDGYPLGWGKRIHDRLKNQYPRGLRWTGVLNRS